eukprot:gene12359-16577_t
MNITDEESIFTKRDNIIDTLLFESNHLNEYSKSPSYLYPMDVFEKVEISKAELEQIIEQIIDMQMNRGSNFNFKQSIQTKITSSYNSILKERATKENKVKEFDKLYLSSKQLDMSKENDDNSSISRSRAGSHNNIIANIKKDIRGARSNKTNSDFITNNPIWEKWSGNKPIIPESLFHMVKQDTNLTNNTLNRSALNEEIVSIKFKPAYWKQISGYLINETVQSPTNNLLSLTTDTDYRSKLIQQNSYWDNMSFSQFITTIFQFQPFPQNKLFSLENKFSSISLKDRDILIHPGDALNTLYIVRSGKLLMSKATVSTSFAYDQNLILVGGDFCGCDVTASNFQDKSIANVSSTTLVPLMNSNSQLNLTINNLEMKNSKNELLSSNAIVTSKFKFTSIGSTKVLALPLAFLHHIQPSSNSYSLSLSSTLKLCNNSIQYKQRLVSQSHVYSQMDYLTLISHVNLYKSLHMNVQPNLKSSQTSQLSTFNDSNTCKEYDEYFSEFKNIDYLMNDSTVNNKIISNTRLRNYFQRLVFTTCPEYDFEEVIDEWISISKEVLQVDRIGFYIVDKVMNTMLLYVSAPKGAESNTQSIRNNGLRMPLKGIAAQVATTGTILTLHDCYKSNLFDSSMDLRTGYHTKQMLSCPIINYSSSQRNVMAVIQFINPLDEHLFNSYDETCATMLARIMSTKSYLIHLKININNFQVSYKLPSSESLKVTLSNVVTFKSTHRHVKCLVRLVGPSSHIIDVIGTNQTRGVNLTNYNEMTDTYPSYSSQEISNNSKLVNNSDDQLSTSSDYRRCDMNHRIEIPQLSIANIPQSCKLILQFMSKNNHPIGWCGISLYRFDRVYNSGQHELQLWDGVCPTNIPPLLESLSEPILSPLNGVGVVTLAIHSNYEKILLRTSDEILHIRSNVISTPTIPLPATLPPGIHTLDWYIKHMSIAEKQNFLQLLKSNEYHTIFTIEQELKDILWRIRYALSLEITNILPQFFCCLDYFQVSVVNEAIHLLYNWKQPNILDVIHLLDKRFSNAKVRSYAVNVLESYSVIIKNNARSGAISQSTTALPQSYWLSHVLYQLVLYLQYEPFIDSALSRFLIKQGLDAYETIGKQLFWYLYQFSQSAESIIVRLRFSTILTIYSSLLPSVIKARLHHGIYMLERIHSINRTNEEKVENKGENVTNNMSNMLNDLHNSTIPEHYYLPFPTSSKNITTKIINKSCFTIDNKNQNQSKKSFFFVFTTTNTIIPKKNKLEIEEKEDYGNVEPVKIIPCGLLYSQTNETYLNVLYNQLLHSLDIIWSLENVDVYAINYDVFHVGNLQIRSGSDMPLVPDGELMNDKPALLMELKQGAVALSSIISESILNKQNQTTNNNNNNRNNKNSSQKIPERLIIEFLQLTGPYVLDGEEHRIISKDRFTQSLAAYLIVTYVFNIGGFDAENIMLTKNGDLFLKQPQSLLNINKVTNNSRFGGSSNRPVEFPLAYLTCFSMVLGGTSSDYYREFLGLLTTSFIAIRKYSCFLTASFVNIATHCGLSNDVIKESVKLLGNNLMLETDELTATRKFLGVINTALSFEYLLDVAPK